METKITRYETVNVTSTQKDPYGNLIVNGTLKVGKKREPLFDVFQPGAEVKIGYASYMNKDYIATAEQTGKHENHLVQAAIKAGAVPLTENPTLEKPVQQTPDAPKSNSTPIKPQSSTSLPPTPKNEQDYWDEKNKITRKSIERQKALELGIGWQLGGKSDFKTLLDCAKRFEKYLETGE
jgi:hypothetical protein